MRRASAQRAMSALRHAMLRRQRAEISSRCC
jgi:hypothetical protein